jgi:hypothetical protein
MTNLIDRLAASPKVGLSAERLVEMTGAERSGEDGWLPNLLLEVSSVDLFQAAARRLLITSEDLVVLANAFPNPIASGGFSVTQLLRLVELDCVLTVEEDLEVRAETGRGDETGG